MPAVAGGCDSGHLSLSDPTCVPRSRDPQSASRCPIPALSQHTNHHPRAGPSQGWHKDIPHPTQPPLSWAIKSRICPQFPPHPGPHRAMPSACPLPSRQPVPVPPPCFLQGFLLLLLLPSPVHYYYDFILMQKRFHKRPLSLPRGAGPTPASLECSPAASRRRQSWRGPRRTPHRAPHTAALFPPRCSIKGPQPPTAPVPKASDGGRYAATPSAMGHSGPTDR